MSPRVLSAYNLRRWLFYKPVHERISLVDREDLNSDPGKYYGKYIFCYGTEKAEGAVQ
jgi:hypothetical protein